MLYSVKRSKKITKNEWLKRHGRALFRDIQIVIYATYSVEFVELHRYLRHSKVFYLGDIQTASVCIGNKFFVNADPSVKRWFYGIQLYRTLFYGKINVTDHKFYIDQNLIVHK
jgi:hypothetical protein